MHFKEKVSLCEFYLKLTEFLYNETSTLYVLRRMDYSLKNRKSL